MLMNAPSSAVTIAPHAETISPLLLGRQKSVEDLSLANDQPKKPQVKNPRDRKLSGRPFISSPPLRPLSGAMDGTSHSHDTDLAEGDDFESLAEQVSSWIKEKRAKRHRRKDGHHHLHLHRQHDDKSEPTSPKSMAVDDAAGTKQRRDSNASDESVDLEKLERIVKHTLSLRRSSARKMSSLKSKGSVRKLLRKQSSASDTEYFDGDVLVPSCDAVLDNSKTLAFTGGASDMSDESESEELKRVRSVRDGDAWSRFKFEIVRLSHTLRLKGWRKVSMEMSGSIEVQRLSGALTNAVYVVSPPSDLPLEKKDETDNVAYSKAPPKLLLRIYGPQVGVTLSRPHEGCADESRPF